MTPYIWNHGHLAWPLVVAIVWCVVCVIATDYVWRIVQIRSLKLAVYASAIWIAGLAATTKAMAWW